MTLNATLITGRTINQGATIENKTSLDYQEATAYCELNPKDIGILGISPIGHRLREKS
jgi:formylmethanofuran dehydrogenase subunit D